MDRLRRLVVLAALVVPVAASACDDGGGASPGDDPLAANFAPRHHVSPREFTGLLVEIDAVEGHAPDDRVIARVRQEIEFLIAEGALGAPDGVRFVLDETLPAIGAEATRTADGLDDLASEHRSVPRSLSESVVHVLYVDGRYEDDDGESLVLGLAWGGDRIAMFADNVERSCESRGPLGGPLSGLGDEVCRMAEASVFLHEMGHVFGLVDNGIPMVDDHEDPDHPAHDVDEDCVMFWRAERAGVVDVIAERYRNDRGDASVFDPACIADLGAAAGSR
ncbi:MAG: hypothetical protein ACQEXJ_14325 [Myxococcota bacterium]